MLFHKRNQKIIKKLFIVIGALIIISMILLYAPGLLGGTGNTGY